MPTAVLAGGPSCMKQAKDVPHPALPCVAEKMRLWHGSQHGGDLVNLLDR